MSRITGCLLMALAFAADTANDRLLVFDDPLRQDSADRVFGHADFNTGGNPLSPYVAIPPPTAKNLLRPHALAVDAMAICTWRIRSTTGCWRSTGRRRGVGPSSPRPSSPGPSPLPHRERREKSQKRFQAWAGVPLSR
jgi:hypothetical protein